MIPIKSQKNPLRLRKPLLLAALALVSIETMLGQAPVQSAPAQDAPKAAAQDAPAAPAATKAAPPVQTTTTAPHAKMVIKNGPAGQKMPPGMPPGMPPPAPKAWTLFKLDPKKTILLDFTESNPNTVFAIMSRASGITILKDPTFKSPLTVNSAKAVGLKSAFEMLDTVLNFSGYELHKKGDLMVVEKIPPPPQARPMQPPPQPDMTPIAKVYRLENANAQQVARVINEVFAQAPAPAGGGGMPPGMPPGMVINGMPMGMGSPGGTGGGSPSPVKVSFDDYANSVVVLASPPLQVQVEALIKELDKSTEQALETEVFKFSHVPADDALGAIKNMLISRAPTGRGSRQPESGGGTNFFFGRGSSEDQPAQKGSQTAFAIKQTNSVVVTATKANLDAVRILVKSMDVDADFIGTTYVVHLENAKASDVATILTQVFQTRQDNSNPFGFFFFGDGNPPDKNKAVNDVDESGKLVNVRDLTGKVTVTADPNTNSLLISTLPGNMKTIRGVIQQIDMPAEQVMIETIIVEATLDKTTKLGTEFNILQGKVFNNINTNSSSQTNFGIKSAIPQPNGYTYTLSGPGYTAFLNALETDSKFKVLSTPRIFTSNNVKAEINVSQKVPYVTSQQVSTVGSTFNDYQFLDVGIILDVTPRVTSGGQVAMDVTQTANELQGFTSFNAPIVNNRSAFTTVSVKDGDTVILGGIIRENHTITENKIPILGDIPFIGNLFKSSTHEKGQTELMVFLTPHIVHTAHDAKAIREAATKELSKGSQSGVEKAIDAQKGGG